MNKKFGRGSIFILLTHGNGTKNNHLSEKILNTTPLVVSNAFFLMRWNLHMWNPRKTFRTTVALEIFAGKTGVPGDWLTVWHSRNFSQRRSPLNHLRVNDEFRNISRATDHVSKSYSFGKVFDFSYSKSNTCDGDRYPRNYHNAKSSSQV